MHLFLEHYGPLYVYATKSGRSFRSYCVRVVTYRQGCIALQGKALNVALAEQNL